MDDGLGPVSWDRSPNFARDVVRKALAFEFGLTPESFSALDIVTIEMERYIYRTQCENGRLKHGPAAAIGRHPWEVVKHEVTDRLIAQRAMPAEERMTAMKERSDHLQWLLNAQKGINSRNAERAAAR
jgi:hypothetical protein